MPTQPVPQASASESSGNPAQSSRGAPPSDPGAAAKTARGVTLFHVLVEQGWDAELAYTADQRVHTMTSDTVAASVQPVLDELRQMREDMATKADLAGFATKADLAGFVTKADLANLGREMAEREVRLIKWMFGAMLAQTAVIVGIVVGVVPLLK